MGDTRTVADKGNTASRAPAEPRKIPPGSSARLADVIQGSLGNFAATRYWAARPSRSAAASAPPSARGDSLFGALSASRPSASPEERRAEQFAQDTRSALALSANAPSLPRSANGGEPLQPALRSSLERRAGQGLEHVRVHHDLAAAHATGRARAQALTRGDDIYFAPGRYRPDSPEGRRVIAHEIGHVLDQRREHHTHDAAWPADPDRSVGERAYGYLRPWATLLLQSAVFGEAQGWESFLIGLDAAIDQGNQSETPADVVLRIKEAARTLPDIRFDPGDGEAPIDILDSFFVLQSALGMPEWIEAPRASYGIEYWAVWLGEHVARYVLRPLEPDFAVWMFEASFQAAVASWGEPAVLLELELEGTLDRLITLRELFSGSDDRASRAELGAQISEAARRALLLDDALAELRSRGDTTVLPLDESMLAAADRIDQIRRDEASERSTLSALGDEPTLLRTRGVRLEAPLRQTMEGTEPVTQEEAFPRASDEAARTMAHDLERRIGEEAGDVDRLRARVVPSAPEHSLREYLPIYDRWFAFFSPAGREADPLFQMVDQFISGMWHVSGMAAEMGVLRILLHEQWAELVGWSLGEASTDFAGEVDLGREERRGGSASSVDYRYAEVFSGHEARLSSEGERESRRSVLAERRAWTRIQSARALDGWTYLITTEHAWGPPTLEARVMPPEVAEYIVARAQHRRTLAIPHMPGFGDIPTSISGVETATATAESRYVEGELAPRPTTSIARTLRGARRAEGLDPDDPRSSGATAAVLAELEAYLDAFFEQDHDLAVRALAVFRIASREHRAAEILESGLSVTQMLETLGVALGVSALQMGLRHLGRIGGVIGQGIEAIFTLMGGNEVSAIIGLASWAYHVGESAHSFHTARVWAYFGKFAAQDMVDLAQAVVTYPAVHAFAALPHAARAARTPRELVNDLGPVLAHSENRQIIHDELRVEIERLRARQERTGETDPDLPFLEALDAELSGESRPGADAESRFPEGVVPSEEGLPEPFRAHERAGTPSSLVGDPILQAALPRDLQGIVVTRNTGLAGRTVEVRYTTHEVLGVRWIDAVEIHAGRDATARDIELHANTARQMQRYQGLGGILRGLLARVARLTGLSSLAPEVRTAAFEARMELEKLPPIIEERLRELERSGDDPAVRDDIEADLRSLTDQLAYHTERVADLEAQGVGSVAARSAGGGPPIPPYPEPPTEWHYYYQPREGVWELRRYVAREGTSRPSDVPAYRLEHRPDGTIEPVEVTGSTPRARPWGERREAFVSRGASPAPDTPNVEAALATLRTESGWTDSDVALARTWSRALQHVHRERGGSEPTLIRTLLERLGHDASEARYDDFRRGIRVALVDTVLYTASGRLRTPEQQLTRLRALQSELGLDSASMGRLFTEYRRARFALERGSAAISYVENIPEAPTSLEGGRHADDAMLIVDDPTRPADAPEPGRYLVEDKTGGSFDPTQAEAYRERLDPQGRITTTDGTAYDGVVYVFESRATADRVRAGLREAGIHVAYFDAEGVLRWD